MRKLCCLLLVFLLLCGSAIAESSAKEATYQRAMEFLNAGEYDMAISIFEMLGDYSDSAAQIIVCENAKNQIYYDEALQLFANGEYDAAKEIFVMLGKFSDSEIQAVRCDTQKKQDQYDLAEQLVESGDYEKAREAFLLLGDFSNSPARVGQMDALIQKSQYEEAKFLETSGNYESAIVIYEALGEYEDCAARIEGCEHQIYIADLADKINAALQAETFDTTAYDLIQEAEINNLDSQSISEWYEEAYDAEMLSVYGYSGISYIDADINKDGTTERILSAKGAMYILSKTPQGLSLINSMEGADYFDLRIEKDLSGREYLLCTLNSESYDIFLLEEMPTKLNTTGEISIDSEFEGTASGFKLVETLTEDPLRVRNTEYIVLSGTKVVVSESPVTVDFSDYPTVNSAELLLKLYCDALLYDSTEEMAMLCAEDADTRQLSEIAQWMNEHDSIQCTDVILWDEGTGRFIAKLVSGNNSCYVAITKGDDGNFKLYGLY